MGPTNFGGEQSTLHCASWCQECLCTISRPIFSALTKRHCHFYSSLSVALKSWFCVLFRNHKASHAVQYSCDLVFDITSKQKPGSSEWSCAFANSQMRCHWVGVKMPLLINVIVGRVNCCFCFVVYEELRSLHHHRLCLSKASTNNHLTLHIRRW
jgi:hypothetical protein